MSSVLLKILVDEYGNIELSKEELTVMDVFVEQYLGQASEEKKLLGRLKFESAGEGKGDILVCGLIRGCELTPRMISCYFDRGLVRLLEDGKSYSKEQYLAAVKQKEPKMSWEDGRMTMRTLRVGEKVFDWSKSRRSYEGKVWCMKVVAVMLGGIIPIHYFRSLFRCIFDMESELRLWRDFSDEPRDKDLDDDIMLSVDENLATARMEIIWWLTDAGKELMTVCRERMSRESGGRSVLAEVVNK